MAKEFDKETDDFDKLPDRAEAVSDDEMEDVLGHVEDAEHSAIAAMATDDEGHASCPHCGCSCGGNAGAAKQPGSLASLFMFGDTEDGPVGDQADGDDEVEEQDEGDPEELEQRPKFGRGSSGAVGR